MKGNKKGKALMLSEDTWPWSLSKNCRLFHWKGASRAWVPLMSRRNSFFAHSLSQSYFLHLGSRLGPVWRINKVFPSLSVAHVLWVTECNNRPAKKGKGKKFFICGLWKSRYPLSAPKKCSFRGFCNEKKAYVCSDRLSRRSKKARKLCWKV